MNSSAQVTAFGASFASAAKAGSASSEAIVDACASVNRPGCAVASLLSMKIHVPSGEISSRCMMPLNPPVLVITTWGSFAAPGADGRVVVDEPAGDDTAGDAPDASDPVRDPAQPTRVAITASPANSPYTRNCPCVRSRIGR